MSVFTDDELKRLKNSVNVAKALRLANLHGEVEFDISLMSDLLARLEAAELCARYLEAELPISLAPVENLAIEAWRKAAGK